MVFIQNLKARKDILISNHYEIIYTFHNEFHLVIYYLQNNKCKIILRKMNQISGWLNSIEIKIVDKQDNHKFEVINIGSSNKNVKILNYYLKNIKLQKKQHKKLKIPKIIFQTHKYNEINNILALNSIYSFQELNPDYEYLFFNNQQCREFIREHFNHEYLYYYDIIYPGAFKADFFRYCFLYINGGFYFDCKNILLIPLDDLISKNDDLLLTQDYHSTGLYNAVMMSVPKNILFLELINTIKYKILHFDDIYKTLSLKEFNKLETFLSLSGPNLLYDVFHKLKLNTNKHILMKHDILGNYQNYKNLVVKFKGQIFLYKNYANFEEPKTHYSKQWKNNEIFYFNHVLNNDYHFFIEPNKNNKILSQFEFEFEFYFIQNKLLILNNNYSLMNISFNLHIINNKSIEKVVPILKKNKSNEYYVENWIEENKYDHSIIKVDFLEKVKNEKDYLFEINKIKDEYRFIILNENNKNWDTLKLNIKTKFIEFKIDIKKENNHHFYICQINKYFVYKKI